MSSGNGQQAGTKRRLLALALGGRKGGAVQVQGKSGGACRGFFYWRPDERTETEAARATCGLGNNGGGSQPPVRAWTRPTGASTRIFFGGAAARVVALVRRVFGGGRALRCRGRVGGGGGAPAASADGIREYPATWKDGMEAPCTLLENNARRCFWTRFFFSGSEVLFSFL